MSRFVVRRLAYAVLVMLGVSLLVFGMSRAAGDPRNLYLNEYSSPSSQDWKIMGEALGLDKPVVVQYALWVSRALKGDMGKSLSQAKNPLTVIADRFGATAQLAGLSFLITVAVGVPLGVLSAVQRGTILDYLARGFAIFGQAVPPFWLGIVLVLIFAVNLGWLPTSRRGDWTNLVLPSVTLAWPACAGMVRITRSAMLDVMDAPFIAMARAKGVGRSRVVWKHAFRNALIPPLTYATILIANFIIGAVVVETVFAWPGIGRLAAEGAFNNDFPLVAALSIFFALAFVTSSFVADIVYGLLDPRVRMS